MATRAADQVERVGTRHVRLFEDTAAKVSDIIDVQGGSAAELLDPLIRAEVDRMHKRLKPRIDAIKAAKAGV